MTAGIPLTDEDRWPWFRILRDRIEEMREKLLLSVGVFCVEAGYRDILRGDDACTCLNSSI